MLLRFILLSILFYLIIRTVRNIFLGPPAPRETKKKDKVNNQESFQQKYKNKIEDADFEELE
ncbi:MAG: hypothetical protein KDF60_15925 [Calditrichaeota bacterium]|nr:hypothetical protein [Calditrichota bacterium]